MIQLALNGTQIYDMSYATMPESGAYNVPHPPALQRLADPKVALAGTAARDGVSQHTYWWGLCGGTWIKAQHAPNGGLSRNGCSSGGLVFNKPSTAMLFIYYGIGRGVAGVPGFAIIPTTAGKVSCGWCAAGWVECV